METALPAGLVVDNAGMQRQTPLPVWSLPPPRGHVPLAASNERHIKKLIMY